MYYRKVTRMDGGEIVLDADMIRLLIAIDETKDLRKIGREVGMDGPTLKATLTKLLELKLVEPIRNAVNCLDSRFLKALMQQLSRAVGPMAEILVEDTLHSMKLSMNEIPKNQAAELIGALAMEIPDEDGRIQFKKAMLVLMKNHNGSSGP